MGCPFFYEKTFLSQERFFVCSVLTSKDRLFVVMNAMRFRTCRKHA